MHLVWVSLQYKVVNEWTNHKSIMGYYLCDSYIYSCTSLQYVLPVGYVRITLQYCIAEILKKQLSLSSSVTKQTKTLFDCMQVWLEPRIQLWPSIILCQLSISRPPPFHLDDVRGRTVNTEHLQKVLQYSVLLAHHPIQQSHIFNIPWRKRKKTLFSWAVTMPA